MSGLKNKEVEIKDIPFEEKKRLVREGKMKWFFPDHVVEQVIMCLFLVVLLITLATLIPPHLGDRADPFNTPEHIKPEWYFLASYQILILAEKLDFLGSWAPKLAGIGLQGILGLVLIAVPFIDRSPERRYSKRPKAMAAGVLAVAGFIIFTLWGHFH